MSRVLTAQAGETLTNVSAQVTISAAATTYRADWPAAQAVWAEYESYTWCGGPGIAPAFDYDS